MKLADFGLSRSIQEPLIGGLDTFGTIYYFAPEMLKVNKLFDLRIDYWQTGIILHEMITGRRPFKGKNEIEIA